MSELELDDADEEGKHRDEQVVLDPGRSEEKTLYKYIPVRAR